MKKGKTTTKSGEESEKGKTNKKGEIAKEVKDVQDRAKVRKKDERMVTRLKEKWKEINANLAIKTRNERGISRNLKEEPPATQQTAKESTPRLTKQPEKARRVPPNSQKKKIASHHKTNKQKHDQAIVHTHITIRDYLKQTIN